MVMLSLLVFIQIFMFSHQVPPHVDPDRLTRSSKFVPDLDHKFQASPLTTYNVKDFFECTQECLGHDKCVSINIAKNAAGGQRECQLLSTDKRDSPADLVASADFHYYDSRLGLPIHCADAKKRDPSAQSGNYRVKLPNKEIEVYCDMQNFGGGWTLVVSINGAGRNHIQRQEVNCEGDLCVPYITANVPTRKLADVDIHQLATEEGAFRLEVLKVTPYSVFYKIPSGAQYFNASCWGRRCPRITISHHHPYQWEYSCVGTKGYYIPNNHDHYVFDGHDDGECNFFSSQYYTYRALYAFTAHSLTGIYPNLPGLLYVK